MKSSSGIAQFTMANQRNSMKTVELALWSIFLIIVNSPLLTGSCPEVFTFDLDMVKMGQIWRVFTYPFAHLSMYHFLMDTCAFLLLYAGLEEKRTLNRFLYIGACGLSSLLFSLIFSQSIATVGLSGLSGVAHGLMAITAMEMIMRHKKGTALFKAGIFILGVVFSKSIIEVWTGRVLFAGLHLGKIGFPIVEAHLGGVIGGIGAFIILNKAKKPVKEIT